MDNHTAAKLLPAILRAKGEAELTVSGISMNPTLKEGDRVTIRACEDYLPGDILVFTYKQDELLIHRLLKRERRYYCKGDNSFRLEDIEYGQIIGKATLVNGREIPAWDEELIALSYAVNRAFRHCGYDTEKAKLTEEYRAYVEKLEQRSISEDKLYAILSALRYRMAAPIFRALEGHPYAVVKGEPLSKLAYGRFGARRSGDIDILIPRGEVKHLESVLIGEGFTTRNLTRAERITALTGAHQTSPYTKVSPKGIALQIDINFDIFWGEYEGERTPMEEFLADTEEMLIHGQRVRVLSVEKAFVQMILHHYKDMNGYFHFAAGNPIRRELFCDVHSFLQHHGEILTPERICDAAEKYHIRPYIYYMLYYTNLLFPDERLAEAVKLLYCEDGEALLDCYGLAASERKRWRVDFLTRLDSAQIAELVREEMTEADLEKLRRSKKLFT